MKKKILTMLLAAVMVLSMAGCGNSDQPAATTAVAGTTADTGTSKDASAGTDSAEMTTYQKIMATGKMTVATEAAFEPFEYIDAATGKIIGYDVDILAYICEDWGIELEQLDLPFQGILTGLDAGQYDMVATAVTISKTRAEQYAFTQPIALAGQMVVTLKGNDKVTTNADGTLNLAGLTIGVQQGATSETVLEAYKESVLAAGGSSYEQMIGYSAFPEVYLDLQNGRLDALVQGRASALMQIKNNPDTYEGVCSIGAPAYYAWCCRKGDQDLVDALNATIQKMIDDGTMAKLQEKWLGEADELPGADYVPES